MCICMYMFFYSFLLNLTVLASWFRLKYPHIALGALASSAPILYFDNIIPRNGYHSIVTKDFKVIRNLYFLQFIEKIIETLLIFMGCTCCRKQARPATKQYENHGLKSIKSLPGATVSQSLAKNSRHARKITESIPTVDLLNYF